MERQQEALGVQLMGPKFVFAARKNFMVLGALLGDQQEADVFCGSGPGPLRFQVCTCPKAHVCYNHTYQYIWIKTDRMYPYRLVKFCLFCTEYVCIDSIREYRIANGRNVSSLFLHPPSIMEKGLVSTHQLKIACTASHPPVQVTVSCPHGPRRWHGMHMCHDWDSVGLLSRRKQALVAQHSSHWNKTAVPARTWTVRMGCAHFQYPGQTALVPVGDTGTIPRWMAVRKQSCFPQGMCNELSWPGSGSLLFYINS